MTVKQATPYLFFDGQARDAIRLYQRALSAKVEGLMTYADMPQSVGSCAPSDKSRVMHALLHIDNARIMISDRTSDQSGPAESDVHIVLDFADAADMAAKFAALSESGEVLQAIHDAFWGDKFGVVRDVHGVRWMFTCALKR